jgi:ABC-type multidrug transport system ATPase subunit
LAESFGVFNGPWAMTFLPGLFFAMGKTIFFLSHYPAEVEKICDRVGLVKNGKLINQRNHIVIKRKNDPAA